MGKLDSPQEFVLWFFSKPGLVVALNLTMGIIILGVYFDYLALGNQYGALCEKFCTACNLPGYRANLHGGCQCWAETAQVWEDQTQTIMENKSWEKIGCPNRNVSNGLKELKIGG